MTAGIAAGLLVMLALTAVVLRSRAESLVRSRLRHAAAVFSSDIEQSLIQRFAQFQSVARQDAIRRLVLDARAGAITDADLAGARRALDSLPPRDAVRPAEIWDADGRRVLLDGGELPVEDHPAPGSWRSLPADSVRVSPIRAAGTSGRFWIIAPVVDAGRVIGYVAQARLVAGQEQSVRRIQGFVDEDITVLTRNVDGSGWVAAPTTVVAPPSRRVRTSNGIVDVYPGRGEQFAEEVPIRGSPWVAVLESPLSRVLYLRVGPTLRLLTALSAVVLVLGAAVSWFVARRLVSRDEMALQIAATRRELEDRAAEAEAARREAENANRAKGDFLAMMSHELRTPLNAIGGYTQLVQLGIYGTLTDAQRNALDRIEKSQAHLLSLISDLLDFARIDAGRVEFQIENVPLRDILARTETLVVPLLRGRDLQYSSLPCETHVEVRADSDKVVQILLNLLGNAIKYTPDGGRIVFSCEVKDAMVYLAIRDTGPGISRERLAHIFEPFVQGERALNRPREGVGLGLAISRELAAGMRGELSVSSALGKGSTFELRLPLAPAPVVAVVNESAQSHSPA